METKQKARVIAFYLPQYHPIPENNKWWGEGFTEWTNVGKAKPLFKGHYQPRVPADLGYYDLRLPEVQEAQAKLAKEAGIEGFCYWHYWFGDGRQLLEMPFERVLKTGKPNFPFCLAWANHSWFAKTFDKNGNDRLLIEQKYLGKSDYEKHFYSILPAFKDPRYIKVDDKPLFVIFAPKDIPDLSTFLEIWNKLAMTNGFKGIHFVAQTDRIEDILLLKRKGFNGVNINRLFHFAKYAYPVWKKGINKILRIYMDKSTVVEYKIASKYFSGKEDSLEYCYPTLIPNWDHSPRSGRKIHILHNSTPELFKEHARKMVLSIQNKKEEHRICFLKSWNEWAEGNYMEPDLRYGKGYIKALKDILSE